MVLTTSNSSDSGQLPPAGANAFRKEEITPELHTTKPGPKHHGSMAGETEHGSSIPSNGLVSDPKAGQWDGWRMSKRMIIDYRTFTVTDEEGARNSPYVSGCPSHCIDCFNTFVWDSQADHGCAQKLEDKIIEDLKALWVQGITFLGGGSFLNTPVLVPLVQRIRQEFDHIKDTWSWTGYTWEELMRLGEIPDKLESLHLIDILIDGRYLKGQKDLLLQFRGSRDQRILDVSRSLGTGKLVIRTKLHDQERDIPKIYLKGREVNEGQQASQQQFWSVVFSNVAGTIGKKPPREQNRLASCHAGQVVGLTLHKR